MSIAKYFNYGIADEVFVLFISSRYDTSYFGGFDVRMYVPKRECPVFLTKSEILADNYSSKTTINLISKAKPGKIIRIGRQSRSSDRCIQLLTLDQKQELININSLMAELHEVNEEINKLIPRELIDKKNLLNKTITKLNSKIKCTDKGIVI